MQQLTRQLNQLCDERPFSTSWYLKDLRSGESADRDGHLVVPSASTRKISIMMAVLEQVNAGKLSLDDTWVVDEEYQGRASRQLGGCFQFFRPGFSVPLYETIIMMIIVSDNTCTGKLVDLVGLDRLNSYCQSVGMNDTTHRFGVPPTMSTPFDHPLEATNTTTAADVGHLLELIVSGTSDDDAAARLGCTSEHCQLAIQILSWQKLTTKLPAQLPPEATVAHKTGTGRRNANDAGIVFANGEPRFVLAVYTDGVPNKQRDQPNGQFAAAEHIAQLARASWDALVA